jgi:CheY-like chemotaxis protein
MKRNILWIEDDYFDIQNMAYPLRKAGFRVTAATSAVEGFSKAQDWRAYDVIIVDIILKLSQDAGALPDEVAGWNSEVYAGLGLLRWLMQVVTPECPVIILSVLHDPVHTYGLEGLGIAGVLLKRGLSPSAMKSEVFRVLGIAEDTM